ncbi:MAG: DUF882 domain-containing protein [Labilithrix sp.]|nr:DUF882 domain-containing protein [Labilithrix sp.]MCW5815525.1 DUF882 domain-containing protein [Labilithrix sp.]
MRIGLFLAAVGVASLSSSAASADVQHVIGKGHTLQAIANRYRVSVKSIVEANHVKDPRHLKIGDILTVPKAETPKKDAAKDEKSGLAANVAAPAKDAAKDKRDTTKDKKDEKAKAKSAKDDKSGDKAEKPKTPGVIHIKRLGTTEEADLRLADRGNKISASTSKAMEKMLRYPGGASHPIEPRLISLLGVMSNHFGSRKIEVISGFRPYTPTQYTQHSNHNHGKAIDFRIIGVPNEQVRDFCRTLKNVGCGYYPNSTFVHMDVRDTSAFWIDYSKPGEPPRYNAANVDADEGTSDVHGDAHPAANTPPPAPVEESTPPSSPSESDPPPATKPADD